MASPDAADVAALGDARLRLLCDADERRRELERRLHAGAQQKLVSLVLSLQMLESRAAAEHDEGRRTELANAGAQAREAIDELRGVCAGLHAAAVAEAGLAAAVEALGERSPVPVEIVEVTEERVAEHVELAAYFVVSEALDRARSDDRVRLRIVRDGAGLVVELEDAALPDQRGLERALDDRLDAVGGSLEIDEPGSSVRARIPATREEAVPAREVGAARGRGPLDRILQSPRASLIRVVMLVVGLASSGAMAVAFSGSYDAVVLLARFAFIWGFLIAGAVAWRERPDNPVGLLMMLVGLLTILSRLRLADSDAPLYTIGTATVDLRYGALAHLAFSFPSGRLRGAIERRIVVAVYAWSMVLAPFMVLFRAPNACDGCRAPENLLLTWPSGPAHDIAIGLRYAVVFGLVVAVLVWLARRWHRATGPARRVMAPVVLTGTTVACSVLAINAAAAFVSPGGYLGQTGSSWANGFGLVEAVATTMIPFAFLVGVLRTRVTRSSLGDLVSVLARLPAGESLRPHIRQALGDPRADVAYWLPESRCFADERGGPLQLAPAGDQVVTEVRMGEELLAAIVHDAALDDDPGLVDGVVATARLVLERARLEADLRAQLQAAQESRTRLLAAGDDARRRVEERLREGAGRRLETLATELLELRETARARGLAIGEEVAEAAGEAQAALDEVIELASGLHPSALTELGLVAAVGDLAARCPVPVEVDADACADTGLDDAAIVAAYFTVAEALANVAKYSGASRARVGLSRTSRELAVEVSDNGVGGASLDRGSGLRGLADRLDVVGGRLAISSPEGGGTVLRAIVPALLAVDSRPRFTESVA